jgi:hypothetical protein
LEVAVAAAAFPLVTLMFLDLFKKLAPLICFVRTPLLEVIAQDLQLASFKRCNWSHKML